jgi:hypothetical protein
MSMGALAKRSSQTVRNHRNAVRDGQESASSLRNVKQNDFNNEAAWSGCGDVKQNNFKIDHILDGFVSAIIGVFESAV